MRKVAGLAWMLGIATLALNATAIPLAPPTTTSAPTQPPPPTTATVRVVGFANLTAPPPALYKGGPIDVRVDLENIGTAAATTTVRLSHPPIVLEQTVQVPPKATQPLTSVTFNDAGGIDESCGPHTYSIVLAGAGADTRSRRASVVPTCSWAPKVEDAWAAGLPAEVEKAKAYLTNVTAEGPIICTSGARIKTTVVNHSAKAGAYLVVRARVGDTVKTQSTPFGVPAGGSTAVAFGGNGSGGGVPEQLNVLLVDTTNNLTADIANRKVVIGFNRACRLAATQVSF